MSETVKKLEKEYGKGILRKGTDILKNRKKVHSISPAFDSSLYGLPEGSWVTLAGHPGCGKTTLSLEIASVCQQDGMEVWILNAEGRLKPMNLECISGLNPDEVNVVGSTEDKILTAEDYLTIGTNVLRSKKRVCMILDSTSSLCSSSEATEDIRGNARNANPKTLASFCRKNGEVVPVMDSVVILIKHLIANTSGYGSPYSEDGGAKVKYQADIKLLAKKNPKDWMDGDKQIGHTLEWEVEKSALGSPGHAFTSSFRYGKGIDRVAEAAILAEDYGVIDKAGAWYSFEFKNEKQKFQGQAKLIEYLNENPDAVKYLTGKINEICGIGQ